MPITSFQRDPAGQAGVNPQVVKINTTDTLATITAASYFNPYIASEGWIILATDMLLIAYSGGEAFFTPSFSGSAITFTQASGGTASAKNASDNTSPTVSSVEGAPVTANDLAVFSDTAGSIKDTGVSAVHPIFPGNVQAGLSGTAGTFTSFPGTAANGSFVFAAVNNASNFASTLSNTAVGQATVYSLPDPANAVARVLVAATATPFVSGNLLQASGTGGLIVDSGITAANILEQTVTVTLNQAAVQNAFATPFQLVAAPGAGKIIVPNFVTIYTNFQTAAFTGGGVAIVQYGNTVHGAGTNALAATIPAAEITAAASQIYNLNGSTATVLTGITNAGLFFSNQTGAFTAGNAASTVVITLNYVVITATV